jgi:hypothetical protein
VRFCPVIYFEAFYILYSIFIPLNSFVAVSVAECVCFYT